MSNSDVRDTVRTHANTVDVSHPPEQTLLVGKAPRSRNISGIVATPPVIGVPTNRERLAAYLSRLRATRSDARRGRSFHGVHDRLRYEEAVRTIAFSFQK